MKVATNVHLKVHIYSCMYIYVSCHLLLHAAEINPKSLVHACSLPHLTNQSAGAGLKLLKGRGHIGAFS